MFYYFVHDAGIMHGITSSRIISELKVSIKYLNMLLSREVDIIMQPLYSGVLGL